MKYFVWLICVMAGVFALSLPVQSSGAMIYVCVEADEACDYSGNTAIQDAVNAAPAGARLILKPGRYQPHSYKDIPFSDEGESLRIRGFVVVEGKELTLVAQPGAILDGSKGLAVSAFVAVDSTLTLEGVTIAGFRAGDKEDNIYDGHGIFLINSTVSLAGVSISDVEKMALTGRGSSALAVRDLSIKNSHLGIWLEEDAELYLENAVIEGSESAGIAAYDRTHSLVLNSVFKGNRDDGLYTTGEARLCVTNSLITGNDPYGIRAVEHSTIRYDHSILHDNINPVFQSDNEGKTVKGAGVYVSEEALGSTGNPAVQLPSGETAPIGLAAGPLQHSLSCRD